jgi:low affinity Fe/Cu permease
MEGVLLMHRSTRRGIGHVLERFSTTVTRWAGSTTAFSLACAIVLAWAATGPIFGFSDTWQLVINTGTTIVTFLMVFLIQRTQNKDSMAIQLKLNELVGAMEGASNRLIDVEDLTEAELQGPAQVLPSAGDHVEKRCAADGVALHRRGRTTSLAKASQEAPCAIQRATRSMISSRTSFLPGTVKE